MSYVSRLFALLFAALLVGSVFSPVQAQDAFITTWETTTSDESITIPTDTSESDYDFEIKWGDGTTETVTGIDPDPSHTYSSAGSYQIEITGTFPRIFLSDRLDENPNSNKLISIDQWGSVQWETMASAFSGAENLTYSATDTPDLSGVINMSSMFRNTKIFNGDISGWDVSNVEIFDYLFRGSSSFNKDISGWDLSNAKSIDNMFSFAIQFNQDIGSWDVSGVVSMKETFLHAWSFNRDLGVWDVSNVEDMTRMFNAAESFSQDISSWDVSGVKDMSGMFDSNFNLDYSLGGWDISSAESMGSMLDFSGMSSENFDFTIQGWSQKRLNDYVIFGAENIEYCDSGPFLNHLEEAFNWFIFDVNQGNNCPINLVGYKTKLIQGDDIAHFDGTGISVEFLNNIGAWITAARYDDSPQDVEQGVPKPFRLVIAGSKFSDLEAKLRVDVNEFGIENPEKVLIFRRPQPGNGSFSELPTTYDQEAGELVADIESFGEFAFANEDDALPVEIANFEAVAEKDGGRLSWQTVSETNNAGFEVQHRASEKADWDEVGYVESKAQGGTTTEAQSYHYTAEDLPVGTHQFRLRQVDLDGSSQVHGPISVDVQMQETLELKPPSPNPVSSTAMLSFAVKAQAKATVAVYDMLGRKVATLFEGVPTPGENTRLQLDTSSLPSGAYIIRLRADGKTETRRMTVVQ